MGSWRELKKCDKSKGGMGGGAAKGMGVRAMDGNLGVVDTAKGTANRYYDRLDHVKHHRSQ